MQDDVKNGLLAQAGAYTLLYLALMTSPSTLSHKKLAITFLPPILSCDVYSWSRGLGFLSAVQGLWATELLLFRNAREDFTLLHFETQSAEHKDRESDKTAVKNDFSSSFRPWKEPFPSQLWHRFVWVTKLLQSLRYTSWDTNSSNSKFEKLQRSRVTPPETLLRWLLKKLLLIGLCLLLQDATNLYMSYDPYFQMLTSIDEQLPRRLSSFLAAAHLDLLPPRAIRMLVLGSQQYAIFSLLGSVPAVVMVGLGRVGLVGEFWGRKENYPAWMGSPTVVFSSGLRGFWSKFWHQLFRQIFLGPGNALISLVHIPQASIYASAFRVVTAFFISGLLHAATLPRDISSISPLKYAMFFWAQTGFVLFEVAVEFTLQEQIRRIEAMRLGKMAMGMVRLIWAGSVLWWTVPTLVDQLVAVVWIMGLAPVFFFPAKL